MQPVYNITLNVEIPNFKDHKFKQILFVLSENAIMSIWNLRLYTYVSLHIYNVEVIDIMNFF